MADFDPELRTSLYVGDLHPDVTEKDLIVTFSSAGTLLSVRLCRDKFSPTYNSLCYGYVNFLFPGDALDALECLNHSPLRGKPIRIMWYERDPIARKNNNGNLFVKNLEQSITGARLQKIFSKYGTVLSCKVAEENGISKGFGFVQFASENSAVAARSFLHGAFLQGKKLYVSKLIRKIKMNGVVEDFRNLFVKHIDKDITADALKAKFSEYGNVSNAEIMKDENGESKGFGFVNFDSHEAAKSAMHFVNGQLIGTMNIVAAIAPKQFELRKNFGQMPIYGYCVGFNELMASNMSVNRTAPYIAAASQPLPFYAPNCQQPQSNSPHFASSIPSRQPIPFPPNVYQQFAGPSNSSCPIMAQRIHGNFNAVPIGQQGSHLLK